MKINEQPLKLTDMDRPANAGTILTVHDEGDSVTLDNTLHTRGANVSLGVRLTPRDVSELMKRLNEISELRGWGI